MSLLRTPCPAYNVGELRTIQTARIHSDMNAKAEFVVTFRSFDLSDVIDEVHVTPQLASNDVIGCTVIVVRFAR